MRVIVTLACTETGDRNYTTTKNMKDVSGPYGINEVLPASKKVHASP